MYIDSRIRTTVYMRNRMTGNVRRDSYKLHENRIYIAYHVVDSNNVFRTTITTIIIIINIVIIIRHLLYQNLTA